MNAWQANTPKNDTHLQVAVFSELLSGLYDESWYGHLTEDEIQFYFSFVQHKCVLEIGSGTGRISLPLLKLGVDLYGIEGSDDMLKILLSELTPSQKHRFILWDAREVPYPSENKTFEVILIPFSTFGLLHNHVKELDKNSMMHEFNRLLQPKGFLLINDCRVNSFVEEFGESTHLIETFYHNHPILGRIKEEQESWLKEAPNRLFSHQRIRERRVTFIQEKNGLLLEEHFERVPLWYPPDYLILGHDAGFDYIKGEYCQFHKEPSILHIFQKTEHRHKC